MDDQFNFFAEADPQYIFAYMDALALGEQPKTGEYSRDPFFVAYHFQKDELAKCKAMQEQLAQSIEQTLLENRACKDFQLAKQALHKSVKNSALATTVVQANNEFDWLARKFHASISFGLFADEQADLTDFCKFFSTASGDRISKNGAHLKKVIWLQYLAVLNVDSMKAIFDAINGLNKLIDKMPPVLANWFALANDLQAYYRQVTRFLDQFDQFANTDLANLLLQKNSHAGKERKICMQKAEKLVKKLCQRAENMQAICAFVMASLADPALQVTSELFAPKSGLARLIANTRG